MLKKKEVVYRAILSAALGSPDKPQLSKKQLSFTQLGLSRQFGFSLNTVNNALKPLEAIGAIEKKPRSFAVIDVRKTLAFWASVRRLQKDVVYSTRVGKPVQKIEGEMPAAVVFTAYSGYRLLFNEAPADYSEVYVYADAAALEELKERFPKKEGPPNLFVLEKDGYVPAGPVAPLPQVYADLWNLAEWYARDFLDALERRLFV